MEIKQKKIPDFPDYEITTDGQIWSCPRITPYYNFKRGGCWIVPSLTPNGYLRLKLYRKGKRHYRSVHRLVLETFVGPCPSGMECRHLDGNKQNNHLDNLCWGTKSQNAYDAIKDGGWPDIRGEKNGNTSLSEQEVRRILIMFRDGVYSKQELAERFKVDRKTIWNIVNRRTWAHIILE